MQENQPSPPESKPPTPQPPATDTPSNEPQPPIPPTKKSKKSLLIGLLILSLLIFGGIGSLMYQKLKTPQPSSFEECINSPGARIQESYPRICVTADGQRFKEVLSEEEQQNLQPPEEIATWKTYTNPELGFSFQYPQSISLNQKSNVVNNINLDIYVESYDQVVEAEEKIDDSLAHFRLGYESMFFKKDVESLKQGKYGQSVDFDLPGSEQIVSLGTINAKAFTVLGRFETCDITFERTAVFYPEDTHRVIITLKGPLNQIIDENPSYFGEFGGHKAWKNCAKNVDEDKFGKTQFYNDLINGATSTTSKTWYNSFDQILSTFKFLD